jgi:hypothetical protein
MDPAGAVDAQNAPTAPWKTAQNAVSHSVHTHHRFCEGRIERPYELNPALHTKFLTLPREAVDKRSITEETRQKLDALAETALEEVTGLMEYLQSPEAFRNARRARERRIASRPERLAKRAPNKEPRTPNQEPGTEPEHEPGTEPEHEPSTENREE